MAIDVGILGATGMVGQQFIALLANHPWFTVKWLGASERSAGKAYKDAVAWRLPNPLANDVATMSVDAATPGRAPKLVFSGLDSSVAGEIEKAFAEAGHIIVSNSRQSALSSTISTLFGWLTMRPVYAQQVPFGSLPPICANLAYLERIPWQLGKPSETKYDNLRDFGANRKCT